MPTEPIITNKRVDDIPILLTQIEQMGVQKLIDKYFPRHGNWHQQLIVSLFRLNHVQAWVSKQLEALKKFFGEGL